MQDTFYSVGPKFFGTTTKKSWFDEGDRCSPGPGAHHPARMNMTNPPHWSVPRDTERDSFLEKYHRKVPLPNRYRVVSVDKIHPAEPAYSIPEFELKENANKIDEGSSCDYRPRYDFPKDKHPNYSFGYHFSRDYSTQVPPPNAYKAQKLDKKYFNKTQRSFSVGERSSPYGEQARYPYVGKYNIGSELGGSKYSIGRTTRPNYLNGDGADSEYNIAGNILKTGQGKTMGMLIEVPANKDLEEFPPPNSYNPLLPRTDRNIINYRSKRQEIKNQAVEKYPSPNHYTPRLHPKEQTVSFTKELRKDPEPEPNPGVGSYYVQKKFNSTLGNMGFKLKKPADFVGPAPAEYSPSHRLTKPASQRAISYDSKRADFSKSVTGQVVGPGSYHVQQGEKSNLGTIGKGSKFEPNKNKNPGPGSYQIPSSIGKLPKYCSGPKKLTTTGFSYVELGRQQRAKINQDKFEARVKAEQEEQDRLMSSKEQDVVQ